MDIANSNTRPSSTATPEWKKNLFNFFVSEEFVVSPTEARNLLIVIATLIATVTFQIGVNPPGGVWQDTKDGHHEAGTAIYAPLKKKITENGTETSTDTKKAVFYFLFLICNTLTLSTSVVILLHLTRKFPVRFATYVATAGMMVTYMSSIYVITPNDYTHETLFCFFGLIPFGVWLFLKYKRHTRGNN